MGKNRIKHICQNCGRTVYLKIPAIEFANKMDGKYGQKLASITFNIIKDFNIFINEDGDEIKYAEIYKKYIESIPKHEIHSMMMHFSVLGIIDGVLRKAKDRMLKLSSDEIMQLDLLYKIYRTLAKIGYD